MGMEEMPDNLIDPKIDSKMEEKEDISKVFEEIGDDIKNGNCVYQICTKINIGDSFKGYEAKEKSDFQIFTEDKNVPEKIKKYLINSYMPIDVMRWDKFGNAAIVTQPLEISEKYKTKEIQEEKGFLGRKKQKEVEIEKWKNKKATLEDFGKKEKDEMECFYISYFNDSSKFDDPRSNTTSVAIFMRKNLSNKLLDHITKKPNDFWGFIKYIEPELLNVAPPINKSYYEKMEGLAVFTADKKIDKYRAEPNKILKWSS